MRKIVRERERLQANLDKLKERRAEAGAARQKSEEAWRTQWDAVREKKWKYFDEAWARVRPGETAPHAAREAVETWRAGLLAHQRPHKALSFFRDAVGYAAYLDRSIAAHARQLAEFRRICAARGHDWDRPVTGNTRGYVASAFQQSKAYYEAITRDRAGSLAFLHDQTLENAAVEPERMPQMCAAAGVVPFCDICSDTVGGNSTAPYFFSAADDSTRQDLRGFQFFCNPPYRGYDGFLRAIQSAQLAAPTSTKGVLILPLRDDAKHTRELPPQVRAEYWTHVGTWAKGAKDLFSKPDPMDALGPDRLVHRQSVQTIFVLTLAPDAAGALADATRRWTCGTGLSSREKLALELDAAGPLRLRELEARVAAHPKPAVPILSAARRRGDEEESKSTAHPSTDAQSSSGSEYRLSYRDPATVPLTRQQQAERDRVRTHVWKTELELRQLHQARMQLAQTLAQTKLALSERDERERRAQVKQMEQMELRSMELRQLIGRWRKQISEESHPTFSGAERGAEPLCSSLRKEPKQSGSDVPYQVDSQELRCTSSDAAGTAVPESE